MVYMLGCYFFVCLFEVFPTYFKGSGCNEARPLLHRSFSSLLPFNGEVPETIQPYLPCPGGKSTSVALWKSRLKNTCNQGRPQALSVSSS